MRPVSATSEGGGDESDCNEKEPNRLFSPNARIVKSRRQRAFGSSVIGTVHVPETLKSEALAPPIDMPEIESGLSPVLVTNRGWTLLGMSVRILPNEMVPRLKVAIGPASVRRSGSGAAPTA